MLDLSGPDLPLVSIIIPVYNGSDWMAVAIDSALAQTYPNIEVIVVNDGSTDGGKTAAIAESYGTRIRYIAQANGGVGSALNTGITAMRGAYFSWLSHDDVYLPEKIETQMRRISEFDEPVVVFGNVRLIDHQSNTIEDIDFGRRFNPDDEAFWCIFGVLLSGCTLLIPRACFEACGLFNPALPTTQDYDLWFRMTARYRFVFTPEILTLSRQHADQGSRAIGHLDEVGLMFLRFIGELPNVTRHRTPGELLAIAQRARALPLANLWTTIGLRLERWQSDVRAQARPLLVAPAADPRGALTARAQLEAIGYAQADLVFLRGGLRDGQDMALDAAAAREPVLRRHGLVLSLADDTDTREVAAAVAALARPDQLVLFWDEGRLSDAATLLPRLDDVLTGRAEAVLATANAADRPLDGLIVRGAVLQRALEGGPDGWQGWLERLTAVPPAAMPEAGAAETPVASLAVLAEPMPAKKRRRVRLPRLLRASSWTAEKNRARLDALQGLARRIGRSAPAPLPPETVALAAAPISPPAGAPVAAPVDTELLILASPASEARDWARQLDRTLKSGVRRMFGHLAADGRLTLTTASPPTSLSFALPDELAAAADYLRRCGVRRLDIVDTELPEAAAALIEELAVPFDVTALSPPDRARAGEAELLERAQRVLAPTGALAERLAAVAGDRLRTMSAPGAREARGFFVEAPPLKPGEALRVLVLSLLKRGSQGEELRRTAALLASERAGVELIAAGEPGTGGSLANVSWLGTYDDRRLIDYVGAAAPHLIWVVLDSAATVAPGLLDVMWTGLPLLVTGPADAAALVRGRALSSVLPPATPEFAAQWIRAFRDGKAKPASAETAHVPAFSRESYLDWRG